MGNALMLSSCSSCSSADIMCMTRLNYSLPSGCRGGGGVAIGKARVVHTGIGEVLEASEGTTAAEIMMDHPNHFLICSTSATLASGKRFTPLASHQELLRNHVYFLLPMHKLRCRLSANDLALLAHLSHKLKHLPASALTRIHPFVLPASARSRGGSKRASPKALTLSNAQLKAHVAPVAAEEAIVSSFSSRTPPPASLWRPSLQTIDEAPHYRSGWIFREGMITR